MSTPLRFDSLPALLARVEKTFPATAPLISASSSLETIAMQAVRHAGQQDVIAHIRAVLHGDPFDDPNHQ